MTEQKALDFMDDHGFQTSHENVKLAARMMSAFAVQENTSLREELERVKDENRWIPVSEVPENELKEGEWMAFNSYNQGMGHGRIYSCGLSHACDCCGESSMYNITHVRRIEPPKPPRP